jgi:hypothetical protein
MSEPTTTITVREYTSLKRDSELMDALRAAGVDNWAGYEEAMAMLPDEDDE